MLIAFHDDRLDRVTDATGRVADLPWDVVRRARVAGSEPILRLEELLEAFPDARVNIEPKHDRAVAPLIAIVRDARALDRVCIGSFSDRRVAAVREAFGPAVCTSLGTREVAGLRAAAWGVPGLRQVLGKRPGQCVQIPVSARGVPLLTGRVIDGAHALGLPVHAWTINDPDEMRRLLDLGVDGLMTDRPGLLRTVFRERGIWHSPPSS